MDDQSIDVIETNVEIKTPDGMCDAAFIHPKSGSYPGVLFWPDAFGLRPAVVTMARQLAAEGYSVLVPNCFYRVGETPYTDASIFNFADAGEWAKLRPYVESVTAPGNAERDAIAYIGFLDQQESVSKDHKIGVQGYCMSGPIVLRTAATLPDRIGAGASFHGGGLVTPGPDSPHLLASKIKAPIYFAIAASDDTKQPDAKDKLKEAFAEANVPAEIEVYPEMLHGWCIPDMPLEFGKKIYNPEGADRAYGKLLALYRTALA